MRTEVTMNVAGLATGTKWIGGPPRRFRLGPAVGLVALLAVWPGRPAHAVQPAARPNIVCILADDLGYGDLSCYGAEDLRTPHLDRLATHGLRFTNFYANCPVCSPTRAALLTGRYPDLVGVPGVIRTHPENNWGWLAPDAVMLPQALQPAGYETAIVGKWHLGLEPPHTPLDRGFDVFHGFLGDMMDDYYNHRRHGINYMRRDRREIDPEGHATDLFTQWACDYLRSRSRREPFFLYLAYNAPHTPIQPPQEWLARVQQRRPGIGERRAKLVALIEHMDAGIGRVLETLDETGLAANTLVVFTSDNGGQVNVGANNGPLRDGKGSVYEGGLKVPAIFAWPGHVAEGTETGTLALTMDIFATLLEAAGVPADPERMDGRSFLPTLLGRAQPPLREFWFFRRREGGLQFGGKTIEAVRRGEWKLLQNSPYAPLELYNIQSDPLERENVFGRERKVVQELSAALRRQMQRYGSVPWQPQR
jgi:arylsulfatase A-like enzyme